MTSALPTPSFACAVAGDEMDEAIMDFVKQKCSLIIGKRMAQKIKASLSSAKTLESPLSMEVRGKDTIEGLPKTPASVKTGPALM
ncbi:MAG: rod shape-determining protein [Pyrinomonadaceae bacterium]|nr:rod shape-determining protein [Pyrinomonadaceae bacterium]